MSPRARKSLGLVLLLAWLWIPLLLFEQWPYVWLTPFVLLLAVPHVVLFPEHEEDAHWE